MTGQPAPDFARLLQQLRAEAGLTQEQLGQAAGVSARTVSDLERGIHRSAHQDTARLLADALGLTGPVRGLFAAAARGRVSAADVLAARSGLPRDNGPSADSQARVERLLGVAIESPYRGLKAFEEQDAAWFFGREAATTALLERMSHLAEDTSLLMVSGVSGAGKSSLLQAGVLPRIQRAGLAGVAGAASWPRLVLAPTRAPLDELALRVGLLAGADAAEVRRELEADPGGFALTTRQAALAPRRGPAGMPEGPARQDRSPPPERRLLLVVDQFEQLFTLCADEGQRRAFITALHAAATPGRGTDQAPAGLVVLGVRADFEARCADYPQLADAVQDRYLVTAMTERQLRMAITEPARKAGSGVDDNLVEVLLSEARTGQPGALGAGALPLLSHALDQAWRSRRGNAVTLADYERTGGIEGAVASSAQRAYDGLTPAQQAVARQVFTRLTATSSDGVDTANRVTRTELIDGKGAAEIQDVAHVLEAFAAQRLLTLAAGSVEISHEILLTAWPLLRDTWLAETHTDRIIRTRLHTTAAEWAHHDRDPSYLYRGSLLQAATDTAARITAEPAHHLPLSQTERDFLRASDRVHRRRVRGRQGVLVFLVVLVIGLASATVLTVRANRQAAHQRSIAISKQLISQSQTLSNANPVLAKLLSVAAWRLNHSSGTRDAMLSAAALPGIAVLTGHAGIVRSVAFSPQGNTLAIATTNNVELWNTATHKSIASLPIYRRGELASAAFSPDGTTLAAGDDAGNIRLWQVAVKGEQITALNNATFRGKAGPVTSVAFSPDGNTLATGTADGSVKLWRVTTGQHNNLDHKKIAILSVGHSPDGAVNSVAFSPDGNSMAAGTANGTVELWHTEAGRPVVLTSDAGTIYSVAFSPDGNTLAAGTANGTVELWHTATDRPIRRPLASPIGPILSVAFNPDGTTLAAGNAGGSVELWNTATRQHTTLTGSAAIFSVAFSQDGDTLATGTANGTAELWDVSTGLSIGQPLTSDNGEVTALVLSKGRIILATGSDTARLWNVTTSRSIGQPLPSDNGEITAVALNPGPTILAAGGAHGEVQLWKLPNGQPIRPLPSGRDGGITAVALSRDGRTLAIAGADGTVRLWNVNKGHPIGGALDPGEVYSMAFSPDGTTLATGSADGAVQLWSVTSQKRKGGPFDTLPVRSVAFGPKGMILATASFNGSIRLWDVRTHRQVAVLTNQAGPVYSMAFSTDGKTLAVDSPGRSVRLWNVGYLVDTEQQLCRSAGRPLRPAEWARYVPQGPAYEKLCPRTSG